MNAAIGPDGVYQYVNPVDLPPIADVLMPAAGAGTCFEAGTAMRVFHRYAAAFLDDPDDVGLFTLDHVGHMSYKYPAAFTAAVDHAQLVGYRTTLTPDLRFFTDEAYAEPSVLRNYLTRLSRPDSFSNEATGLVPSGRDGYFHFQPAERAHRRIDGVAVVLCSDEPLSYGSFLFRVVPKVLAIRKLGLTHLPCIVAAQQPAYRELLLLSGLPDSSIVLHDVSAITHIDRAIIPCLRNNHGYLDPQSCELFAELRATHGDRPRTARIYVSRLSLNQGGWSTRVMENEPELIERLASLGFDIVTPEHLSVREQIAVFASATLVVGPSGSNMYNTMFCHPGTKVIDIQSEPQWIYSYTGMYSSLQLDYGIFVGRAEPDDLKPAHRRWRVNIDALVARIDSFCSA